ncbi:hypothetical protein ACFLSA_06765, partial [Bacteroidota bacterium]
KDLFDRLKYSGEISKIETDIILQKLRNIYELVLLMEKSTTIDDKREKRAVEIKEDKVAIKDKSLPKAKRQEEKPGKTEKDEDDVFTLEKAEKKDEKSGIIADRFSQVQSRNEALLRKQNKDLSKKIKDKPFTDIRKAIGVSDKFRYIKELFNNDSDLYNSTINKLNEAGDAESAIDYLNERFDWNEEDVLVAEFMDIVKRKDVR